MACTVDVQPQGDGEYLVHLEGDGETVDSTLLITPAALDQLGATPADEEQIAHRAVQFLLRHQAVPDFPRFIDLEDVLAGYEDFPAADSPSVG
jgi:hypothetical protein